ncbi:hydantoin racemase [Planosporangium thailandense]|uniref:Hydantoin racemase n=1 Tax=Planosporangium thailandense TaxID=765197 RepID=A0ABX0XV38_9ACTN|nr:aspartate/glutamate racemase family protein [Planosporangium thailandense]NJC69887.1 hydantoin racemase [Planosporangium thailandense]
MRIAFLNPFGTAAYDELVTDALTSAARADAEVVVQHLDLRPENIDYYAAKHLIEVGIMKAAIRAERDGFDAFVIGCCYDPALTQARELVNIPVVAPLEASVGISRAFGHSFAVVTDHHKAVPEIADRIRLYGMEANCKTVTSVGWFVNAMVRDTEGVAKDAYDASARVLAESGAETVIIGCTIVSACYEKVASSGNADYQKLSVINPNIVALKQAEVLADMNRQGQYRISRAAYYQPLDQHDPVAAAEVFDLLS